MNRSIERIVLDEDRVELIQFLQRFSLNYESDIEQSFYIKDQEKIIATASISKNIIKCFAIDENYQGLNIANDLMTHVIHELSNRGIYHYFVFTKPSNLMLFESLGLKELVSSDYVSILEGGISTIKDILLRLQNQYSISGNEKAALVMNCNPMTLGHLYLIEQCAKENEEVIVFIVEEDRSYFPFQDRFEIVKEACANMLNVTVVPSTEYMISSLTFPTYFLKETDPVETIQAELDVLIFKNYFMPLLHINKRYVGNEPYCITTSAYNKTLERILGDQLLIVQRLECDDLPISASHVRSLIQQGRLDEVKKIVPVATWNYLNTSRGKKIINELQR